MLATAPLRSDQHSVLVHRLSRVFTIPGRSDVVRALDDVSLGLEAGTFTAVVGASGSGKSTLLHCVAGLDRPTSGSVELLGTPTSQLNPRGRAAFRAAHVGFIFQEYNLISALTAAENVALPSRLAGAPLSHSQVDAALERVGIAHRRGQLPHQLSGGERQRVAVARVMANQPQLVFADEPTGALDPTSAAIVLGWLRELADDGSTVMMVTHDVAGAALADEVVVMHAGHVAAALPGGDADRVARTLTSVREGVAA